MNLNKKVLVLFVIFYSTLNITVGQNRISSPYSRYGIGSLQNRNSIFSYSMGNLSKSISSPTLINFGNPASYSAFDSMSFVFDGALISSNTNLLSTTTSQATNYVSLSYFMIGFPITKRIKTSFGLLPYSDIGYKIIDKQELPNIGNTTFNYEGDGGITQFYWGNSFKILPSLSVGLNASYLFGNLIRTRKIEYETTNTFNTLNRITNHIHGFLFQAGIQHKIDLGKQLYFASGFTYGLKSSLKTSDDIFSSTYSYNSSNEILIKDTVENFSNQVGKIEIPISVGGGFSIGKTDKFLVGIDAEWQKWEDYRMLGNNDSLKNSIQIVFGGMYTPDITSSAILKRTNYRMGIKYYQSYLDLKNTQINDVSANFGMGIPLRKTKNHINIGIEVGQFGTTSNDLIKMNYVKLQIGMQFYERWFMRRKYD